MVRRVRTAAGAARYKQPIGSIIIRRGGKTFNLESLSDHDLIELMGDARVNEKSPHIYEAAFTEWARRQPDVEPDRDPPFPDDEDGWLDPAERDSVRVELLSLQLDEHRETFANPEGLSEAELAAVIDDAFLLEDILDYEQRLAAVDVPEPEVPDWAQDYSPAGAVDTFAVDPARAKRFTVEAQAQALADSDGISYYEALAQLQDKPTEQVYRDEFKKAMGSSNFIHAIDDLHTAGIDEWIKAADASGVNGYWFTKPYDAEGRRPEELWRMNAASVEKYASDEAKAWFYANGRVTVADLRDLVDRGVISDEPATYLEAVAVHGDDMRSRRARPKRNRRAERDRAQAKRDVKAEAEQRALGGVPDGDGAPDSGAELDVTVDQRSHDGMSDTTPAGIKPAFRASRKARAEMAEGDIYRHMKGELSGFGATDGESFRVLTEVFRDFEDGGYNVSDVEIPETAEGWGLFVDEPGAEQVAQDLHDRVQAAFEEIGDPYQA